MTVDTSGMRISIVLAVFLAAGPARAGGIVLESFTGQRPADADRLLSPVLDELARRQFETGDTVARAIDAKVSRPATAQRLPSDFAAQVEQGQRAWAAGRFDDAVRVLAPLVEAAHASPGELVGRDQLRDSLQRALVALALSQFRMGDPSASLATFDELLRAFPDAEVARGVYGPEAADSFAAAKRRLAGAGKGKVVIEVADPRATVFVDEHYQSVGSTTVQLSPGEYRVIVKSDGQLSRSHRVVVRAGGDPVPVAIDPKLDQALHTGAPFTGFLFTAESDRDKSEAPYARDVAHAADATAIAVIGIDQVKGRPAIVGALISLQTGREIRRASVAMEPDPSTERLRALARFLAGDEPAAGLDVELPTAGAAEPARHDAPRTARTGKRWGAWKWIAGGVAVAALGTGLTLVALDGHCSQMPSGNRPCNNFYQTGTPGWIVVAGGAIAAGASIYMFATDTRGGAMVGVAGRF